MVLLFGVGIFASLISNAVNVSNRAGISRPIFVYIEREIFMAVVEVLTRINDKNLVPSFFQRDSEDIDVLGDWVKIYQADEMYQCKMYVEKKGKDGLIMRVLPQQYSTISISQKEPEYFSDGWRKPSDVFVSAKSKSNLTVIKKLDFLLGRVSGVCKWEDYATGLLNSYGVERMLKRGFRVDDMSLYCSLNDKDGIAFYYKSLAPLYPDEAARVIIEGGKLPTWY